MDSNEQSNPIVPLPPARPTVDSGSSEPTKDHIAGFQRRLRTAVAAIDEGSRDTSIRAILSGYYKYINRGQAHTAGVEFPVSLRRHPLNAERASGGGSKPNVLFFHVGNACYGLFETSTAQILFDRQAHAMGPKTREKAQAKLASTYEKLERRVRLIELIAKYGLSEFFLDGGDNIGYSLMPSKNVKDDEAERLNQEKSDAAIVEQKRIEERRKGLFPVSVSQEDADAKEDVEDGFEQENDAQRSIETDGSPIENAGLTNAHDAPTQE